jgi:hypothetical protein
LFFIFHNNANEPPNIDALNSDNTETQNDSSITSNK